MNFEFRKGILFIRFPNGFSRFDIEDFRRQIDTFLVKNGIRYFVFNFENVPFLDERVISVIEENYQKVVAYQGRVLFCGLSPKVVLTMKKDHILQNKEIIYNEIGAFQCIQI